jgi:hypothetical protein
MGHGGTNEHMASGRSFPINVFDRFEKQVLGKLDQILSGVLALMTKGIVMSQALDELIAQVAKNQEVEASAILLIQGISQQLKDAIANGADPVKLAELTLQLDNSAQALAAAVAANTVTA